MIEESVPSLLSHINDDENIGAVLVEFDFNVNYIKLQKAATYLNRKECLFIAGAGDARVPIGLSVPLIGMNNLHQHQYFFQRSLMKIHILWYVMLICRSALLSKTIGRFLW